MHVEQLEPVYLQPEGPLQPTEYGKRHLTLRREQLDRHAAVLRDIAELAKAELWKWPRIQQTLRVEGVPVAVSGISQSAMHQALDALDGKTTLTAVSQFLCGMMSAPSAATTGVTCADGTSNYTNYARQALTASMGAASTASPSVATNTVAYTFPGCGVTGATWLGFVIADNATVNLGNAWFFGPVTSVVISSVQTPPTVAIGALTLNLAVV